MSRVRKIATAAGTFSVALGIGFVMQNGDVLAARFGEGPRPAQAAQDLPGAGATGPAVSVIVEGEAPVAATATAVVTMAVDPPLPDATPDLQEAAVVTMAPVQPAVPPTRPLVQVALPALDDDGAMTAPPAGRMLAAPAEALAALPEAAAEAAPGVAAADPAPGCRSTMTASAAPAAMARLVLTAPCVPSQAITLHHEGLSFTAITDVSGMLDITVPALAVDAVFIADLGDGSGAVAVIRLPELALVDRAVLQWSDTDGLNLHAFEFGAAFGESGHVWQAAARDPVAAETGAGGFLTLLGDPAVEGALLAQVYTYPSGAGRTSGSVELTVEAQVTAANCGRGVAAQAIQLSPGGDAFSFDLTMTMPDCTAVGEFLVLPEMLMDLALAAN